MYNKGGSWYEAGINYTRSLLWSHMLVQNNHHDVAPSLWIRFLSFLFIMVASSNPITLWMKSVMSEQRHQNDYYLNESLAVWVHLSVCLLNHESALSCLRRMRSCMAVISKSCLLLTFTNTFYCHNDLYYHHNYFISKYSVSTSILSQKFHDWRSGPQRTWGYWCQEPRSVPSIIAPTAHSMFKSSSAGRLNSLSAYNFYIDKNKTRRDELIEKYHGNVAN